MQLAAEAMRGQMSAHSFATGPAMAEPERGDALSGRMRIEHGTCAVEHAAYANSVAADYEPRGKRCNSWRVHGAVFAHARVQAPALCTTACRDTNVLSSRA